MYCFFAIHDKTAILKNEKQYSTLRGLCVLVAPSKYDRSLEIQINTLCIKCTILQS